MKKEIYYLVKRNIKKLGLSEIMKELDPKKELDEIPFLLTEKKRVKQKDGTVVYKYHWSGVSPLPGAYEQFFIQTIDADKMEEYEALWKRAVRKGTEIEDFDRRVLKAFEFKAFNVFTQGGLVEMVEEINRIQLANAAKE